MRTLHSMKKNIVNKTRYLTRKTPGIFIDQVGQEEPTYGSLTDSGVGGEAWKLEVGAECNTLLDRAELITANLGRDRTTPESDQMVINTIHSIVARVAEFEELETEP